MQSKNTALAIVNREQLQPQTLDEIMSLGEVFAKSGFFQDAKDAAKCVVKILAGQELGIAPIASMRGIHIISNNTALSANLMAAAIKKSGRYNYRVTVINNEKCEIDFYEKINNAWTPIGTSPFTAQDAKDANALEGPNKHNWTKYRRNMLYARAMSNGARWFCADVFGGAVYDPEELGESFDPQSGDPMPSRAGDLHSLPVTVIEAEAEKPKSDRSRIIGDIRNSILALRELGDQMFLASSDEERQAQVVQAVHAFALEYDLQAQYKTLQAVKDLSDQHLDQFAGWLEGRIAEIKEKAIEQDDIPI